MATMWCASSLLLACNFGICNAADGVVYTKHSVYTRLFCSKYKLLYITKMFVQAYVDLSKLKQIKVHRVYVISIKLKLVRVGITYI